MGTGETNTGETDTSERGTGGPKSRRVHTKVTRQDWIDAALTALADEPVDQLRVLGLAKRLGVSRSSFYWYFETPDELRSELLARWDRNTASIVERTERDTETIVGACLSVFECWADPTLFVPALDLSIRDWGRRDVAIAERVAEADTIRLDAITRMFVGHEFSADESTVRARLLYHSQVGYDALGTHEPMSTRLAYLPYYLEAMAGAAPTAEESEAFRRVVEAVSPR